MLELQTGTGCLLCQARVSVNSESDAYKLIPSFKKVTLFPISTSALHIMDSLPSPVWDRSIYRQLVFNAQSTAKVLSGQLLHGREVFWKRAGRAWSFIAVTVSVIVRCVFLFLQFSTQLGDTWAKWHQSRHQIKVNTPLGIEPILSVLLVRCVAANQTAACKTTTKLADLSEKQTCQLLCDLSIIIL